MINHRILEQFIVTEFWTAYNINCKVLAIILKLFSFKRRLLRGRHYIHQSLYFLISNIESYLSWH
ncbi:hypothetical protein RhiirC2_541061 [Rhizophagus irregularis]|uniref:Uncharacterized protein n=1 Tax=Rhizophagus irregularis TaxID=588596 RepID=A0A2N1N3C2_9GLOM|nr:hypothetical protein RhiirC2_541061 [Rhizophagus irregularis]